MHGLGWPWSAARHRRRSHRGCVLGDTAFAAGSLSSSAQFLDGPACAARISLSLVVLPPTSRRSRSSGLLGAYVPAHACGPGTAGGEFGGREGRGRARSWGHRRSGQAPVYCGFQTFRVGLCAALSRRLGCEFTNNSRSSPCRVARMFLRFRPRGRLLTVTPSPAHHVCADVAGMEAPGGGAGLVDRVATGPWPGQAAWRGACGAPGQPCGPGTGGETAVLRALLPPTPGGAGGSPACLPGHGSSIRCSQRKTHRTSSSTEQSLCGARVSGQAP